MTPAIRVSKLGKRYRLGGRQLDSTQTFREAVTDTLFAPLRRLRRPGRAARPAASGADEGFWALKDLNLDVQPGEVVGIIGRNGAGKSTLLKVLSRIVEPTEGRAELRGRVGSLLEVGTGFHPELTGRENIFMNGSILGMTRREVQRKFDDIVAFADVAQFLDTPVKRYSSGMYVRLAFAVAANIEPEILIVDEVLAVGDVEFQRRCLGKMGEVARSGRTVLFVSHNMAAVQNLCSRAVLLHRGGIIADGDTSQVVTRFMRDFDSHVGCQDLSDPGLPRKGNGHAQFTSVELLNGDGEATSTLRMGEGLKIRMGLSAQAATSGRVVVNLVDDQGLRTCAISSLTTKGLTIDLKPGQRLDLECRVNRLNLMPRNYSIILGYYDLGTVIDEVEHAASFDVVPADVFGTGQIPLGITSVFFDADWDQRLVNGRE